MGEGRISTQSGLGERRKSSFGFPAYLRDSFKGMMTVRFRKIGYIIGNDLF
jgi:hypothetical protein